MTGLLLVNLGTPDAATPRAVRRYLREFLGDPRVIDINRVGRTLLLELIILPTRPRKSARAYAAIWDEQRGSPLMYHSRDLAAGVADALGPTWHVELAMRYGRPDLAGALDRLVAAGVDRIVVVPLFPQYASSTTGSALEALYRLAAARTNVPPLTVVPPFYADDGFVAAWAEVAAPRLAELTPDHVLFSFHGLPERHLHAADPGQHCLRAASCCDAITAANQHCYRAQCFATARAVATRLDLAPDRYTVCFQSRLGRVPWIRPYTDEVLAELAGKAGTVAVLCPAFVADCLETLEEIGLRAAEQWRAGGGERLELIPSLNASPAWIDALAALVRRTAGLLLTEPRPPAHA